MEIKTVNLNKKIANRQILKNINTIFYPEGINVLIGPNGAGKTSFLRQISLLDKPTSGEIFYANIPVSKMSNHEKTALRRKIGFVFQNPIMLSSTVYENLIYGLEVRGITLKKNKIEDLLSKVDLLGKIDQEAKTLSGGEKQRLSLARVLILEPEYLFFDEPTVNLDPLSVETIENIITDLAESKKIIILATHNLRQARQFGKKIFFLQEGKILQEGSADEVFSRPLTLDIAEYSFAENIIHGKISAENGQTYLVTDNLKISVVAENITGEAVGILRPEDIFVSKSPLESSARNCFQGMIKKIECIGAVYFLTVEVKDMSFETIITKQSLESMNLSPGNQIYLTFKATAVHLMKPKD